jgi:hypothetical protein
MANLSNDFRLGTPGSSFYVAKGGTTGAGTSTNPNDPKDATAGTSGTYIVGAGGYEQSFTFPLGAGVDNPIFGDGRVVFTPTSAVNLVRSDGSFGVPFNNIIWNLNGFPMNYSIGNTNGFTDCVVKDGSIVLTGGGGTAALTSLRTVFKDIVLTSTVTGNRSWNYCQIYNSTFTLVTSSTTAMRNTYVDEATIITWAAFAAQAVAGGFLNNNFMGKVQVGVNLYELKKDKAGATITSRVLNGILDIIALYPNVYTTGKNFAQDAEFGNLEKQDFRSVAYTSPNLYADTTGLLHIGNVLVATPVRATDAPFATGDILNLTVSAGDFTVTAGTSGNATSEAIQVAPIAQAIGLITFAKLDAFNSSFTRGNAKNNNVTAVLNHATGSQGEFPRRLTYEMRWSNKTTAPVVDADWENQSYVPAGGYSIFECDTQPKIDSGGFGNGVPGFVTAGSVGIKAKWLQYRITVRNGLGYV